MGGRWYLNINIEILLEEFDEVFGGVSAEVEKLYNRFREVVRNIQ